MARDGNRLAPALDGFQTILAMGNDRAASIGILNATGITDKTDALFQDADVREVEKRLRSAERDLEKR
jgi:hypothetical protein